MKPKRHNIRQQLLNQFYIKYYMQQAGNDAPQLKKDMDTILAKLESKFC